MIDNINEKVTLLLYLFSGSRIQGPTEIYPVLDIVPTRLTNLCLESMLALRSS